MLDHLINPHTAIHSVIRATGSRCVRGQRSRSWSAQRWRWPGCPCWRRPSGSGGSDPLHWRTGKGSPVLQSHPAKYKFNIGFLGFIEKDYLLIPGNQIWHAKTFCPEDVFDQRNGVDRGGWALVVFHLVVGEEVHHTGPIVLCLVFRECSKERLDSDCLAMVIDLPWGRIILWTFVPGDIIYKTDL